MKKGTIIKTAFVAALSVSFLFSDVSYASVDNTNSLDENGESIVSEKEKNIYDSNLETDSSAEKEEISKNDMEEEALDIISSEDIENNNSDEKSDYIDDKSNEENEQKQEYKNKQTNEESSKENKDDSFESVISDKKAPAKENIENKKTEKNTVVYIAEFLDKQSKEKAIQDLKSINGTNVLYEYDTLFNGLAIETLPENLDKIKLTNGIKSLERSQKLQAFMNHASKEIGIDEAIDYLKVINASYANKFDGRGTVIANIDTGVDYRHKAMRIDDDALEYIKYKKEDLKGSDKDYWLSDKIPHAFNYFNGGKITIEKYDDNSDYYDPHGMHIAGILAGNDTKEDIENYNGIDGIAPNAQIFSYKIYSDASTGFAGDETMFHAIEDAIKHNVDVVSISSGFTGTGLIGEKYWQAIRALRKAGIPLVVATGNYATSASSSSWDLSANNDLRMIDTGNVTRTAAHEDAIAVASAKNQVVEFDKVNIGGEDFKYRNIGAFFDKEKVVKNEDSKDNRKLKFVYIGKGQDQDLTGLDLKGKIAVMDRIYTKDLKYAFKKATDKGARAIMVVNTVNYYNRDNWTDLPAMGYEEDDATTSQVFSVSGNDGLRIWNMINPDKKVEVKKNNVEDYKDKLDQYYPLDMASYNANKPNVGDERELDFKFAKDNDKALYKENVIVPAGSTSWGPRIDLLLKPDISAPGKNIKSTLNVIDGKSNYGYMSGTSMAAPVVAASTVLLRPKINEMLNSSLIKNLQGDDKIDFTSLTKIALQNTATPMMDPTSWNEKSLYLASPRQQGAGLINVGKAVKNDVIATFKNKDSNGSVNSYGSISLKEIKGNEKYFTIKLYNTSNRPITFRASSSAITTDGMIDRLKLDETYKDETTNDGKKVVPEIHPSKVNNASITFEHDTFTINPNSSFDLNAVINVGDAADKNKFVESFIHFESQEEIEAINSTTANQFVQPSLSMPLMGFAGNWNNEPILDKWAWEKDPSATKIQGYDDDGKPKIPGTLNKGIGGKYGIDKFNPAAVIQNRKDGDTKSLDQNPDLFAFNNNQDLNAPSRSESNIAKVYPLDSNGQAQNVEVEKGLTPSPLVLRSAEEGLISIVNNKGEGGDIQKDLKVISREHFIRGILNSKENDAKGVKSSKLQVWGDLKWDGLIYNPRGLEENVIEDNDKNDTDKLRGQFEPIAEGQYYYKFKYRLTKDYPWQVSYIPVKIDNTSPEIVSLDFSNPEKIKLLVKDTYHKVKDEYKNETLFSRDQKLYPEKFDTVANEVWYAGAALVDSDGNVEKDLSVTYAGEGEDKNRKLDKYGNTVYEINGAGDLRGKIIEVIALDGANNFTKIHRIKFSERADERGNISYYLIDPDVDSSKYQKLGEIPESKFSSIKSDDDNISGKENPNSSEEVTPIEGESIIEINEKVSTLRAIEEKDLKKTIKIKTKEVEDFVNGGTMTVELYYLYDDNGNIIAYEDGSDLEYEIENIEEAKSKINGVLTPSEEGSFELLAKVNNVSRNAKVYYGNDYKSVEITSTKYDPENKTMIFDLYANINDITNGVQFAGDMKIYVRDGGTTVAKTVVRMPEMKTESKEIPPYSSSYSRVIEMNEGDLIKIPDNPSDMDVGKLYYDKDQDLYFFNDKIAVREGYAIKVTSYNPGKTDMIENNGVYSSEDIEKIQNTNPNIKAMSEKIIFSDSRNQSNGKYTGSVLMASKEGFNIIRYQVFKIKVNDKGEAIDKNGNLVDLNKPENLVLFAQDGKEYISKRDADVEAIREDGSMLYIDTKPINLSIDNNYFNPSPKNKIYVRNQDFYLKGKIGDMGGFNWEMRINESIIDNYLIYGDLHSDNRKDFNVKIDVRDGDIMDWGMKDYSTNGFPDEVRDLDGNVFIKTGYSPLNARALGVHYQFLYDNVKPEVKVDTNGNTPIEYVKDKFIRFNISDLRDNEKNGEIQEKHIFVNGKEYKSLEDIEDMTDEKLNIKIIAKDFARNTTVKEFIFDKLTGEIKDKERQVVSVKNNGNNTIEKIKSGEDYILPSYNGQIKEGYKFIGWKVDGEEKIREINNVIYPEGDMTIRPEFIKVEESRKYENTPTFDLNDKNKRIALEKAKELAIDELIKSEIDSRIIIKQIKEAKSIEEVTALKKEFLKSVLDESKKPKTSEIPGYLDDNQSQESIKIPVLPNHGDLTLPENKTESSVHSESHQKENLKTDDKHEDSGIPMIQEETDSSKDSRIKSEEKIAIKDVLGKSNDEDRPSNDNKATEDMIAIEPDLNNIREEVEKNYNKNLKEMDILDSYTKESSIYGLNAKRNIIPVISDKKASKNVKTGVSDTSNVVLTMLAATVGFLKSKKRK